MSGGLFKMEDFKLFLDKHLKKNGDKLLPTTKERYTEWIKRFKTELDASENVIETMNKYIKQGNIVMYASFVMYLKYKGFTRQELVNLERPPPQATFLTSVRKLQEQTLSRAELKILMETTKDLELRLIFSMLYDTAARRHEFMNIRFSHIEPIKEPKDNIYAKVRIMGKGHKAREVYLGKVSFELLKEYAKGKKKRDYVIRFIQPDGKEYKSQDHQLWKVTQKHCKPILGRNFHCHMFRHCVSEDTEVLTTDGWKHYNELNKTSNIFTLNMKSDEIQVLPLVNVNVFNVDEELVHIKTVHIDSLVTKDHKNVLRIAKEKQETKEKQITRWTEWGNWELLSYGGLLQRKNKRLVKMRVSGYKNEGMSIGLTRASILGWVLSDGSIDKKYKFITISQSLTANPEKVEIIRKLLHESCMDYSECLSHGTNKFNGKPSDMVTFRIPTYECKWILDFINIDRTPKWNILDLNGMELDAIYENMMLGDGSRDKEYAGQNIKRIDFIRVLCALTNRKSTLAIGKHNQTGMDKYRTYICYNDSEQLLDKHFSIVPYKGVVWCPSTKNGTFVCRRNGHIFITGNTALTHLADNGAPVEDISKYAGHSSVSTTMIYIHNSTFMGQRAFRNYSKPII
jgi:integrase